MERVAIIGAGVMGSALAFPLTDNGCAIALCGTAFDRAVIAILRKNRWHPALQMHLPDSVEPHDIDDIDKVLEGASILILGVVSEAVGEMVRQVAPRLAAGGCIVNVAKGVEAAPDGRLRILPEIILRSLSDARKTDTGIVAVAGPCKALELAARRPTQVVFASSDEQGLQRCRAAFATSYYRVQLSADVQGVELCAAAKNGYAIGLEICDGIDAVGEGTHDNLRAAVFTQAVAEMAGLAVRSGGRPETACGLAGLGDLFVTYRQGRNQTLGRLLGQGLAFGDASAQMKGATVEGVEAVRQIHRALQAVVPDQGLVQEFPLLDAIHTILFRQASASTMVQRITAAAH
jgi:glycerol-3-phosphate dehydrogenase (NAD(P)+)